MEIELRHLRALVAVVDAGQFTAAAQQLGVSQPAVTKTIQQLETILGTRLIDRTSRVFTPTSDGAQFVEKVRDILHDLDCAIAARNPHCDSADARSAS
ncbi:MAG: LysR family transcriptional regulator [Comamonadaceae bacterium]|nr:MAG: LysR family transcriptional regulator [Comamonadaceae bacterium]